MRIARALATVTAAVLLSTLAVSAPATAASPTGHKKISAQEVAGGKIQVSWKATSDVKYYQVKTSTMPDMSQNVKTYKVSKKKVKVVVAPAKYAGVTTGNYTFVRVYAIKKNGKKGESPYKNIRLTPVAPTSPVGVNVATYNVRTAEAKTGPSWDQRKGQIVANIAASGAAVVAIQESGAKLRGGAFEKVAFPEGLGKDFYWQFEEIDDLLPQYQLVDSDEYYRGQGGGKESTRILYDPSKVTLVDKAVFAPSSVDENLQYVPYAKFTDLASGKPFYFFSVHLANNAAGKKEAAWSRLRVAQANNVISNAKALAATGVQVIIAGDMNSNMYTAPSNVVDEAFIKAGAYDAYAAQSITNEFYATFNEFDKPKKSASRTDYIFTFGPYTGSFAYTNWVQANPASDHNMQSAVVPI